MVAITWAWACECLRCAAAVFSFLKSQQYAPPWAFTLNLSYSSPYVITLASSQKAYEQAVLQMNICQWLWVIFSHAGMAYLSVVCHWQTTATVISSSIALTGDWKFLSNVPVRESDQEFMVYSIFKSAFQTEGLETIPLRVSTEIQNWFHSRISDFLLKIKN